MLLSPAELPSLRYAETSFLTCPPVPAFPSHFLYPSSHSAAPPSLHRTQHTPSPFLLPLKTHLCCETRHLQRPHIAVWIPLSPCFLSLNLLTSEVLLLSLQLSASQNHCICPGCSRIKSSWGTRDSCCFLSKTKHSLQLQLCVNSISRLKWSFFPRKEHPCNCPALKLFCPFKVGKRHLAKSFPNNAGNC